MNEQTFLRTLLALASLAMLAGCAATPHPSPQGVYHVTWTATRSADHAPLISPSVAVRVGQSATLRMERARPTEDKPAFTRFTVRLSATKNPGVLQLVSRVSLMEAARNKKGKLRITKRNIGALLPMRPGETQPTNAPGDPVDLAVRLEHG